MTVNTTYTVAYYSIVISLSTIKALLARLNTICIMSRSALSRQEGNVKDREHRAEEIFRGACDEGRSRNAPPIWSSDDTFNLHPMLLRNMVQSQYFQQSCEKFKNWNAVIDEIYYQVKSLQPFQVSTTPSTAFCLLLRLMTMRMTVHQLDLTLNHADSPYIRGIGFLYVRYCCLPDQVYDLIQPYFFDEEELTVAIKGAKGTVQQTMGEFVRNLFSSREYHGTTLPRYPLQIERHLSVKILQADKVAERANRHFKNQQHMRVFQTLGSKVMGLYEDAENPLQWYHCVVDRVLQTSDTGVPYNHPRFVVTFTEYGNTETVLLGELDVVDGKWRDDRFGAAVDDRALYQEVQRRERDRVTADRNWARQPPTTKSNLAQQSSHRRVYDEAPRHYSYPHDRRHHRDEKAPERAHMAAPERAHAAAPERPVKRSAEEEAAIADKKRRLMAKYG